MNRWYKRGRPLLDEIKDSRPQPGEAYIWFMGQHGFVINLGGAIFYIDVILNDLKDGDKSIRVYPPPFDPAEIQRADYVLCTHNHIDHLNLDTILPLARTNAQTKFVVPAPCKGVLTGAGIATDRVMAARAGEDLFPGCDITLSPVPAIHTLLVQDQGEKDENGDFTSLGFVLKGEGLSIYHAGDTWVTPSLIKALKALGPFNIAMLPINGTDWKRTGENCIGNMNPLDAVKLAQTLPVDMVFPSHYDMIAHNSENPARFADSMYALCPEKRFHVFAPGECFIYKGPINYGTNNY